MFDILDCGSHKYFPFGSVGNGDYYCFDLKNQKVVLFEHESGKVYGICNTYTELIKGIVFDEE